jgi:hypothetical protein
MTFLDILEKIQNKILRKTKFKNFVSIESLRSESDDGMYSIAVQETLTNKKKFNNFKSNIFYQDILEHVNYPQGLEYLNIIKRDSNLLKDINKFLINDQIGNPKKYYYEELKTKISPTTLRYIKVASDIKKIF